MALLKILPRFTPNPFCLLPFRKLQKRPSLRFRLQGAWTPALSGGLAVAMGHWPTLTKVGQLGTLFPEGIIWTTGLGMTAFFYYAFAHQTALSMETKMNKDKDALVCEREWQRIGNVAPQVSTICATF